MSEKKDDTPIPPSTCPVNHQSWSLFGNKERQQDSSASTPSSIEEAARYAQTPQPNQRVPMSTNRQVSSIPRSDAAAYVPVHQKATDAQTQQQAWVYPSEQQIYNAMIRKGHKNIPEESISTVLQIHNGINENTWKTIVSDWENNDTCQLARFEGRPKDTSPKAFLLTKVLQRYDPPFDRHDWYVTNLRTGDCQRYVIDYYALSPSLPYVDVRPAVDGPRGMYLRSRRFMQLAFPGITTFLKENWRS